VVWWFLQKTCTSIGGGALTLQGIYVEQVPIIDVFVDRKKPIIELTKRILAIKAADPEADVSALETEIDARVAQLYGLTEEEYLLILSETDTPDDFRTAALNAYRDLA